MFVANMACKQEVKTIEKTEPPKKQVDTSINKKPETTLPFERPEKPPYGFERSPLHKGDSIMIYGGDSFYMMEHFGVDTLRGKIIHRAWSKAQGGCSFLAFQDAKPENGVFAISEQYWDSKRGYNEAWLSIWERIPSEDDQKQANYDMFFTIDNFDVERGIRFKKLK